MTAPLPPWPDILAGALVGGARSGRSADALLDAAAAHALRRRAGTALRSGIDVPVPAPADDVPVVGPAAAARAADLLAFDAAARQSGPLRDLSSRLELLAEWLAAAAAAGRRLPGELVPALLDAGRRHRSLRPLIGSVAGTRAGWLAGQRRDWAYASGALPTPPPPDPTAGWEFGTISQRRRYLMALRGSDPAAARVLLEAAWDGEQPEDRAALLVALGEGLSDADEPLLERALDDRRKEVRAAALDLLGRLPGSAYAARMTARAAACVHFGRPGRVTVDAPTGCDRSMRRDGISPRPPGGVGERAWWLEEIVARTPLDVWPPPSDVLARRVSDGWAAALRRGLARAAATQRNGGWAAALVDSLTAEVAARGHPDDRLLLEALYDVLPAEDLARRAATALRRGLAGATAVGVEHVLQLCPRPWPDAVVEAVFTVLAEAPALAGGSRHGAWRVAALCDLAALRVPEDCADRALGLLDRLRTMRSADPGIAALERLAATLRFRHDMYEELA